MLCIVRCSVWSIPAPTTSAPTASAASWPPRDGGPRSTSISDSTMALAALALEASEEDEDHLPLLSEVNDAMVGMAETTGGSAEQPERDISLEPQQRPDCEEVVAGHDDS